MPDRQLRETKLIHHLRHFQSSELDDFAAYLAGPRVTSDKTLPVLFTWLRQFYPDFTAQQFTPLAAFKVLFPSARSFSAGRVNQKFHDLYKLTGQFFRQRILEEDPALQQQLMIRAYASRKMGTLYRESSLAQLEELDGTAHRGIRWHFDYLRASYEYLDHPLTSTTTEFHPLIDKCLRANTDLYALLRFDLELNRGEEARIRYAATTYLLSEETKRLMNQYRSGDHELLRVRVKLLDLAVATDASQQVALAEELFSYYRGLSTATRDHAHLYLVLVNHYIRLNRLRLLPYKRVYEIHRLGYESGMYFINGVLSPNNFLSVVLSAVTYDLEFAREVVARAGEHLRAEHAEQYRDLAHAYVLYRSGDHSELRRHIAGASVRHTQSAHRFYGLELRSHYDELFEQPENDRLVLSKIDAYEQRTRRLNYGTSDMRVAYRNFCSILRKMVRFHQRPTAQKLSTIRREVDETKPLVLVNWLTENVTKLEPLLAVRANE